MSIKDLVNDLVIISLSGFLLWHFSMIWRYGEYLIGEPNIVIRSLETVVLLAIFVFGVNKFVRGLRSEGGGGRND